MKFTLVLLAAFIASVSALPSQRSGSFHRSLGTRQDTSGALPSACVSVCNTPLTELSACENNGTASVCAQLCTQSGFNALGSCFQCDITNTPATTAADVSQLQSALTEIQQACGQAGVQITLGATLTGGSGGVGSTIVSSVRSSSTTSTVITPSTSSTTTPAAIVPSTSSTTTSPAGILTPMSSAASTTGLPSPSSSKAGAMPTAAAGVGAMIVAGVGAMLVL